MQSLVKQEIPFQKRKKIIQALSSLEGVKGVCRIYFKSDYGAPLEVTNYQARMIRWIVFKYPKKIVCTATTRAGKSLALSIGLILLACLFPGEKIRVIAPTIDHTKIIMGYIIQHFLDSNDFMNMLMFDVKNLGVERIKKELTKHKLTLINNSEIMAITANISGEGRSLVGFGGTMIVIDEIEQMPTELIRTKVMRMLGDSKDAAFFGIGNPVSYGFMYEKSIDPDWKFFKIDCWECIREGRLTKEFVEERQKEMLPNEFKVWYEADWPDELSDQLFSHAALNKIFAPLTEQEKSLLEKIESGELKPDQRIIGIDVARYGVDLTVFSEIILYGGIWFVLFQKPFPKQSTMVTAGIAVSMDQSKNYDAILVDDPGLGGGVTDRLAEQDETRDKIVPYLGGSQIPQDVQESERKKYANLTAYCFKQFTMMAANGEVRFAGLNDGKLLGELRKILFEQMSNGKIKIIKPADKSPDFADSLNIALANSVLNKPGIFTTI